MSPSLEAIARVCHEANRAWCLALGDTSQKPWDEAEPWQRDSAILGVEFVLSHPAAGDSAQHDHWSDHKVREGWVWGPVKDSEAKTHPCLVPWSELPVEQQAKDRLFRAIVVALTSP